MDFFHDLVQVNTGDRMIQSYEIRKENNEEVLILHLNFSYEFGNLWKKSKKQTIKEIISEYIKQMKIDFHGGKILLVVGGVSLATIFLSNIDRKEDMMTYITNKVPETFIVEQINQNQEDFITEVNESIEQKEEIKENEDTQTMINNEQQENTVDLTQDSNVSTEVSIPVQDSNSPQISQNTEEIVIPVYKNPVTIYRNTGSITMEFEDYIVGVVAAEMPASFESEALKAQAVVARTYAKKVLSRGGTLTDTVSTQVYKDEGELRTMWGNSYNFYYNKIKDAVLATEGLSIYYGGDYIDAVYHSTSNGFTEAAEYVWGNYIPYLQSVESPWDTQASSYLRTEEKSSLLLWNTLGLSIDENTEIKVISRDQSGRVSEVVIGSNLYDGITLRKLLNLRSTDFDLEIQNGNLIVTTRGYGHGVGMSQYGANGMAKEGYSFIDIIKHYYTGVSVY